MIDAQGSWRVRIATLAAAIAVASTLVCASNAFALLRALQFNHYGAKVDATNGANFCTPLSGDECQKGEISTVRGGFGEFGAQGVAIDEKTGNILAVDTGQNRVEEFKANGEFVFMLGKKVNATTGADVCAQADVSAGATCGAGERGEEPGAFSAPTAVAVDPVSGDIYISETFGGNERVDKFDSDGKFIFMLGKGVNATTGGNVCTESEIQATGVRCQAGNAAFGSSEPGAFVFYNSAGELAVGGPRDLLYVGSEHRVEEYDAEGAWVGEIPLSALSSEFVARATALTLDQTNGDLYLVYEQFAPTNNIYKFSPQAGKPTEYGLGATFTVAPRESGASVGVEDVALDGSGHLAATVKEIPEGEYSGTGFGALLDAGTGSKLSEFTLSPSGTVSSPGYDVVPSLAFNPAGELYAGMEYRQEVRSYLIREGAELRLAPPSCAEGTRQGTSATFECVLNGEVNPANVPETEAWFQWGTTNTFGHVTPLQAIATGNTMVSVDATAVGLVPNQAYYYRLAAFDANFKPPIPAMTSNEEESFTTPRVAPVIVGAPDVAFIKDNSAVLRAKVNPEHASTSYGFEYGTCGSLSNCSSIVRTPMLESSVDGIVGATLEAHELQPETTYHYRLIAHNQGGEEAIGSEGSFTTAPLPSPQAVTGPYDTPTATGATIYGDVDPDGAPASYKFELGVYNPIGTQFVVLDSAAAGEGKSMALEALQLSSLQPATEYAYRIAISSAFIKNEAHTLYGAIKRFRTAGLSAVLVLPPLLSQLPIPKGMHFPRTECKRGFRRNTHGQCVRVRRGKRHQSDKKGVRRARGKRRTRHKP